ncbi:MAG: hypothetical protein FJ100_16760 [Deltaproteobacteria bacterium]|nr:hypothetical protein [Deltaproteobacteria bacterium]
MTEVTLQFGLLSDWHISSSAAGGMDVDAEAARTAEGLPYLPGKAVKGVVRDAVDFALRIGALPEGVTQQDIVRWFGTDKQAGNPEEREADLEAARYATEPGALIVTNAELGKDEIEAAAWRQVGRSALARTAPDSADNRGVVEALFRVHRSTALTDGVAATGTLRALRAAVPMNLYAVISGPAGEPWPKVLRAACPYIAEMGSDRTRGLGRVRVTAGDPRQPTLAQGQAASGSNQSHAWLVWTLLDDAVLQANGASTGPQHSLDFLPGGVFLGAAANARTKAHAASAYEAVAPLRAFDLFHAGMVRFGRAVPTTADFAEARPVPLSIHTAKDKAVNPQRIDYAFSARPSGAQYGQVRSGWITPTTKLGAVKHRYTMRTAIADEGGPEPSLLFGYDALARGQTFLQQVTAATPHDLATVVDMLCQAPVRIGRSRGAEFGRAVAQAVQPATVWVDQPAEAAMPPAADAVSFWLLSDVALIDEETAQPRLQPRAADFGLPGKWKLDESKTFTRTRRWSPYNGTRRRCDVERQVLVAGSVVTFTRGTQAPMASPADVAAALAGGIGIDRAEGLGRVVVYDSIASATTMAALGVEDPKATPAAVAGAALAQTEPYCSALEHSRATRAAVERSHQANDKARGLAKRLRKVTPSQWGELRQKAVTDWRSGVSKAEFQLFLVPEAQAEARNREDRGREQRAADPAGHRTAPAGASDWGPDAAPRLAGLAAVRREVWRRKEGGKATWEHLWDAVALDADRCDVALLAEVAALVPRHRATQERREQSAADVRGAGGTP